MNKTSTQKWFYKMMQNDWKILLIKRRTINDWLYDYESAQGLQSNRYEYLSKFGSSLVIIFERGKVSASELLVESS